MSRMGNRQPRMPFSGSTHWITSINCFVMKSRKLITQPPPGRRPLPHRRIRPAFDSSVVHRSIRFLRGPSSRLLGCQRGVWMKTLALLLLCASGLLAQTIVVSPDGPIKTLAGARDAARAERQKGVTGAITIQIGDGIYYLNDTLVLTPEDSNTIWEAAPGARPAISGGRVITGWKKGAGSIWTANAGDGYFRQLFVSGRRA